MDSAAGLHWRALTLTDVPALTALFAKVEEVDRYGRHYDAGFLTSWLNDPLIDLERGTSAAFDGARLVAAGVLASRSEANPVHQMRFAGCVHPDYRRSGLGTALMDWVAGAAVPLHTERFPGQPLEVHAGVKESDPVAAGFLESRGFTADRFFHDMTRAVAGERIPPARVPDGFEIVAYDAALDEAVRVAKNEAFRDHWGTTPTSPEVWRALNSGGPDFRPALSPLAVDAATREIVGLVLTHFRAAHAAATGRRDAHISLVGTVRRARGRGLATALVTTALAAAAAQGFDTASLGVDSANPTGAVGVYERCGFVVDGVSVNYTLSIAVG